MVKSGRNPNIAPGASALLVIDVQRALFSRPTPIYEADRLISHINALVDAWEQAGGLVVYVQHSNKKLLVKGTSDWEIHREIRLVSGSERIHKLRGNAFEKTELEAMLSSRGIEVVVITGLVTQGCVRASCIGALDLGYRVVLVEDGHSNYSRGAEKIVEEWNQKLADRGAQLMTVDRIVAQINRAARAENSRE